MGKNILLAEDSMTIRKVFELAFARSDVSLTMVDNGEDAVRIARETHPDLVVADVTLPGMDGFRVAEELAGPGETPVLILSGMHLPFDEERFGRSGASGVLFKPFDSQELAAKVKELLSVEEETSGIMTTDSARPEESWDFSDVLEEVEKGVETLQSGSGKSREAEGGLSLNEFDVSLEEIDKPSGTAPGESHIEGDPFTDAPPAVTDLEPALEEAEGEEETESAMEAEAAMEGESVVKAETAAEADALPEEPRDKIPPAAPSEAETALREAFSARAQEIFGKAAAEAVEKVLWEQMERLTAEFSARIRESVEAVAWEVIPQTAEALIREEIARIRRQAEKKSP